MGTPLYTAPERLREGQEVDARCDVYSVGALAFKLLTGRDVFEADSVAELCTATLQAPPRRPSTLVAAGLPPALDVLVVDCLAKDPALRPESASAVLDTLTALGDELPWSQEQARAWWDAHEAGAAGGPG
jgi:serine/threonine-protein kinase